MTRRATRSRSSTACSSSGSGRSAESILASLDNGIGFATSTAGYVYLGTRIVRGWAIEFVLIVALIPYLAGVLDLFARSRRRQLPLTGAWRALRTRAGVWLWAGFAVGLGALAGVFPRGSALPPPPDSPAVTSWSTVGLALIGLLVALGWLRARQGLLPRSPATPDEVLAGYTVSLLALGVIAIATAVISAYALIFVVPSLYAWLWLPQIGNRGSWFRDVLYGIGLAGPILALIAVGTQLQLGLNAPLYILSLMTLGLVSWPTILALLAWAAVATQLGALASGRYASVGRRPRSRSQGHEPDA